MKKFLSSVLALSLLLSLSACGSTESYAPTIPLPPPPDPESFAVTETTPVEDEPFIFPIEPELPPETIPSYGRVELPIEKSEDLGIVLPVEETVGDILEAAYSNVMRAHITEITASRKWHRYDLSIWSDSDTMLAGSQVMKDDREWTLCRNNLTGEYIITDARVDEYGAYGSDKYQRNCEAEYGGFTYDYRYYQSVWAADGDEVRIQQEYNTAGYIYQGFEHWALLVALEPYYEMTYSEDGTKIILSVENLELPEIFSNYGNYSITIMIDKESYRFDKIAIEGEAWSEAAAFTYGGPRELSDWGSRYPEDIMQKELDGVISYRGDTVKDQSIWDSLYYEQWMPAYSAVEILNLD